jgi:uncharacterized phage protein (TIGR01671 family)
MEIKCRALSLDEKEWVYGYYCEAQGRGFIVDNDVVVEGAPPPASLVLVNPVEVDPETVCLWTGCTDAKDIEIYEGDICKAEWLCTVAHDNEPHELQGTIEWSDDGLWMFDYGHGAVPLASNELSAIAIEVIGNALQHRELLEKDHDDQM